MEEKAPQKQTCRHVYLALQSTVDVLVVTHDGVFTLSRVTSHTDFIMPLCCLMTAINITTGKQLKA